MQFKRPVMGLLGAVLFILFVFFFFVIFLYEKNANEDEVWKQLSSVDSLFSHYAEVEQEFLGTFLKTIESDKVLQQAFLSGSREDIDQVIAAGQRATALVQQILDFSRKAEQTVQPLQPHLVVQEALRLLRSTLPSIIEIQEDIDPASGTILADPTKIHQIVMNLCTNGFHALNDEKGTLLVTLSRQEKAASP